MKLITITKNENSTRRATFYRAGILQEQDFPANFSDDAIKEALDNAEKVILSANKSTKNKDSK